MAPTLSPAFDVGCLQNELSTFGLTVYGAIVGASEVLYTIDATRTYGLVAHNPS